MSLTVSDFNSKDTRAADLSDVLVWLGWEPHGDCGGTGDAWCADPECDPRRHTHLDPCSGCAFGLVPSTSIVEEAKRAILDRWVKDIEDMRGDVVAALVASVRDRKEQT